MAWGDDDQKDREECARRKIHYCEPGNPYVKGRWTDRAYHPQAREVGEQEDGWPGGDIITNECPVCGTRWKEGLPQ